MIADEPVVAKRIDWLDALKATALIFVVFGHILLKGSAFFVITSPVKIPLFFAVSGYLFSIKNGEFKPFFIRLIKTRAVPWIILSFVVFKVAYSVALKQFDEALEYFYVFLSGIQLWYIPCCIIAEIILFFIVKYSPNFFITATIMLFLSAAGYIMSLNGTGDFAKFNTALISLFFMLIGLVMRRMSDLKKEIPKPIVLLMAVIYAAMAAVSFICYPDKTFSVSYNDYYNVFVCGALIVCGVVLMFYVAPKLKYPKFFLFMGRNTLVIYIMHGYFLGLVDKLLLESGLFASRITASVVGTACVLAICSLIAFLINKYLPFIVGAKKQGRNLNKIQEEKSNG